MNPQIVPFHRNESLVDDGMLFVRTEGILNTMIKAPLILAGLIVVAFAMPIQTSFSSTRTLELTMYSDGSTHISTLIEVDSFSPDFEIDLFGPSVDNFVAVGDDGFLLSSEIIESKATIDTLGSSTITVDYDIHDLISKEGRVWTFSFDSPSDYSLLMPSGSIIVGMTSIPNNMEIIEDQTKLELSNGPTEINYILGTPIPTPIPTPTPNEFDYTIPIVLGGLAAAGIAGASIIVKTRKSKTVTSTLQTEVTSEKAPEEKFVDPKEIFDYVPDMREDDKKIVQFISEMGGQVFESELRKKFLQPRTTMWRAVKRLERLGVIEISKKDLQNLVTLKKELEEEEE
ncbi:MAG: MarR family transcriptional regulator [Nitrososphaeria archaeon]|nr:MarR family transcriptional regulator [Nitrosopumilaceae archaeon]NIP09103.1 MarR family transcriptional regulator [Nitrosopumilaceae archaeon]NIP91631.1 MarR family transcriptional regulator [Nitrososphaeria archaeon]NIS95471.1 MarR family transcriptional regulator [Nitrosopumilaceae archaeon]